MVVMESVKKPIFVAINLFLVNPQIFDMNGIDGICNGACFY